MDAEPPPNKPPPGRAPGWYQRADRDWAAAYYDFPAQPTRLQVHVASDGSEWTYEFLAAEAWDLTRYA